MASGSAEWQILSCALVRKDLSQTQVPLAHESDCVTCLSSKYLQIVDIQL